ncbi:hypothetical protein CLCR_04433 [Cladophialophora carrionii]|uniref:Uncharacterized protein n=1 Tax=Cladophialophora carrionii TaxID=86049 RepID=A0A1C1CJA4_9EURO|nr:hypothetical protein CLCR_04433 [Cladophialophora carrionii]
MTMLSCYSSSSSPRPPLTTIPIIWRSPSTKRARLTIPTIRRTQNPLSSFPCNSLGAKFSEDFIAEYNESIALAIHPPIVASAQGPLGPQNVLFLESRREARNCSWAPSRPPSPFTRRLGQTGREAA